MARTRFRVKAAKARSIGVSILNQGHLDEIKLAGLPTPDVNQIELHPGPKARVDFPHDRKMGLFRLLASSSLVPISTWRTQEGYSRPMR
jgi:2,5-diketo-D-gluconate reductase A